MHRGQARHRRLEKGDHIRKCYKGMWLERLEKGMNMHTSYNRKVKIVFESNTIRLDGEFGRRLRQKFSQNKLFWKEVNIEGGGGGVCMRVE